MSNVKLIWATPDAEKHILYMARVSSPKQDSSDTRLLTYLLKHKHVSPFEMANMCVEINTSRAISAQILRHRSFSFQEFSQRYAENTGILGYAARRQDTKNRQNSLDDLPMEVNEWFQIEQLSLFQNAMDLYQQAINKGIAKECARMVLPMATATKLYMNGTLRSWIHYLESRTHEATQLEHREIALEIEAIFAEQFPIIHKAYKEVVQ